MPKESGQKEPRGSQLSAKAHAVYGDEEKYRLLFDFSLDAIYINDADGSNLEVNQAWLDLLGYTREELKTFNAAGLYADPSARQDFLTRLLADGYVRDEVVLKKKDGAIVCCERSSVCHKDADGQPLAFQGILRDVTEQRRMQSEIRERQKEMECLLGVAAAAETASKSLDDFLRKVVEVLPSGYQYVADAAARIIIEGEEVSSDRYRSSEWSQTAPIRVDGLDIGLVEVVYLDAHPAAHEGQFLHEERQLIEAVAARVGRVVQRVRNEKALIEHRNHLEDMVAARTAELERQTETVRRQAEEILEVSTPVMRLAEGVLVAPLIGTLDSVRTQQFMDKLLHGIVDMSASVVLVDITGVPSIDTGTAQHLIDTITAVRLLGAQVVLTGVRPAIAQTLVHLGVDLSSVSTRSSLSSGLTLALNLKGRTPPTGGSKKRED
ncbi:MAG: PAS domain S-box protein [Dehalococcoidia bacterium]|nr:PAS domain S-box protein [Dehalococcoidia bacterium]